MRRLVFCIVGVVMAVGLLALPAASALAAGPNLFTNACNGNNEAAVCSKQVTSDPLVGPDGLIGKVTRVVALWAGVIAVIIIIVGGLMYVLSSGDSGKISTARTTIIYATVGLVVIAVGQAIVAFVIDKL